jgi:hypothetical protein
MPFEVRNAATPSLVDRSAAWLTERAAAPTELANTSAVRPRRSRRVPRDISASLLVRPQPAAA